MASAPLDRPLAETIRTAVRDELITLLGARTPSEAVIPALAADALVGLSTVCTLTSLSDPQIWRMVAAGNFPKPLSPSSGRRAWLLSEIKEWIAARKAERDRSHAEAA